MIKKNFLLTVFILVLALVLAGTVILKLKPTSESNTNVQPGPQVQSKTFKSERLAFSMEIPSAFKVEEGATSVLISNGEAEIVVVRNGTEFSTLTNYLQDFDSRNKWEVIEEDELAISSYQDLARIFRRTSSSKTREKVIFIYVNYSVYKLSTTTESLFDDLDQIARSFRYTSK